MNPEKKQLILEALRSGEYQQTKGRLHRVSSEGQHSYCCLGVICEVAIADGLSLGSRPSDDLGVIEYFWNGESDRSVLPLPVVRWLNASSDNPVVNVSRELVRQYNEDPSPEEERPDSRVPYSLADLNDAGVPFEVIADLIEEQL